MIEFEMRLLLFSLLPPPLPPLKTTSQVLGRAPEPPKVAPKGPRPFPVEFRRLLKRLGESWAPVSLEHP